MEESTVAKYELEFGEWYLDVSRLPERSGIYCVYACERDPWRSPLPAGLLRLSELPSVSSKRLLYIGESRYVRSRVANHERQQCWKRELKLGERLCFRAARFPTLAIFSEPLECDRRDLEAALIDRFEPPCNRRLRLSIRNGALTVWTSAKHLFDRSITVQIARSPGLLG